MSTQKSSPWRVIEATVQDFKRVKLAELHIAGPVTTIAGKNKAGKTCTIDGLLEGLKSGRMAGVDVVRHGADAATITVHLSDGDAHLYTRKSQDVEGEWELEVRDTPDGRKRTDGPKILKQIIGAFVDLSALANATGPERIDMLLAAIGKKDELDALNAREKDLIAKREEKGRQRRDKAGELEGMAVVPKDTPDEPVNTHDLLMKRNEMQKVSESNARIRQAHNARLDKLSIAVTREEELQAEIVRLSADLKNAREWIGKEQAGIADEKKAIAQLAVPDFTEIDNQISTASIVNESVTNRKRYATVAKSLGQLSAEWDAFQAQVEAVSTEKTALLESLDVPYPGLGVSTEHSDLTVDGALWSNLSKAEEAAVTVALAAKLSPNFRFGVVRNSECFDEDTAEFVDQLAQEYEFFIFKEVPGKNVDGADIVIVDGVTVGSEAGAHE